MRLLVTGGAGFIGSHLTERLLDLGHQVRVLDNFSTGKRENLAFGRGRAALDVRDGDLRDEAEVRLAVTGVDAIFHQAALVSVPRSIAEPELSFEINARGTLRLFEAARGAGVRRIVYASSAAVYGDAQVSPLRETMAPRPLSPYGLDKLYTEQLGTLYASLHGLEPVALRYFNVFGPRQDPGSPYSGVISIFVDRLRRGESPTIYGDGEQTRDFIYVLDVVEANLVSMWGRLEGFRVFNVGRGQRLSLNGLAALLQDLMDVRVPLRYAPARVGDVRDSQADISAIATALGFAPQWDVKRGLGALVRSLTEDHAA